MKGVCPVLVELNVCKRSDAALHNVNMFFRCNSLDDCLRKARAEFQCPGDPDIWLTLTNSRRQQINKEENERLAPEGSRLVDAKDEPMLLYEGAPLIGMKIQRPVLNGVRYTVQAATDQGLHLLDDRKEQVFVLWPVVAKSLALGYAITIMKSQSLTLPGHVRICPGFFPGQVHTHFSTNHLLVAASRATALDKLSIE